MALLTSQDLAYRWITRAMMTAAAMTLLKLIPLDNIVAQSNSSGFGFGME